MALSVIRPGEPKDPLQQLWCGRGICYAVGKEVFTVEYLQWVCKMGPPQLKELAYGTSFNFEIKMFPPKEQCEAAFLSFRRISGMSLGTREDTSPLSGSVPSTM